MTGCSLKKVKSEIEKTKEVVKNLKDKIKAAVFDAITGLAANIGTRILKETVARIKAWLKEAISPAFPFPIQLDLLIGFDDLKIFQRRRKRSIEDDVEIEKSRLAGKIIDAIALEKKWKDKGIAWFAYANNETEHNNTMSIRFLVTDRWKYESVYYYYSKKPANLSSPLVELSEAVLKGTLNNLKIDGESIDIMALNGCIDWNCKEHAFNITFLKLEERNIPVTNDQTTQPTRNQATGNQTTVKPKGNNAPMYPLSLACLVLFVINSFINIS